MFIYIYYIEYGSKSPSSIEIQEYNNIMNHWYRHPDFDDFLKIYKNRAKIARKFGNQVKYWLWGVYITIPEFYNRARLEGIRPYMREIEASLRAIGYRRCTELVKCMEALFHATGDERYLDYNVLAMDGDDPHDPHDLHDREDPDNDLTIMIG